MFSLSYKGKQGKIVRWSVFLASAALMMFGVYRFYIGFPYNSVLAEQRPDFWKRLYQNFFTLEIETLNISIGVSPRLLITLSLAIIILLLLAYFCFKHVRTSEFLINTEDEMRKVAWPTPMEVVDSSVVVIIVIIVTGLFLFASDILLDRILRLFFFK
ncbi:MAG TPA: preprotein translocase subunit SecE [Planctomycetota bacterium]|jgi:preprotein translocase SecE subunit|nr:preprotein translocase subunit SecE [Planctomycetota bacterium]HPY73877.1 preprotein translocase subunit SecE [Planctomycetota bacterium]HQA99421.1 preprotein translocase subunit SecE [Planctomycetota bacterium]HRU50650.1 preprotein translocase subunit SecE [Planctomycetota bacterium]